jgi:hypothetical protein
MSTSNVTAGFIDLATYDELEKYMYGGADATAYFVRETRKATWFTQVPVVLSRASGVGQKILCTILSENVLLASTTLLPLDLITPILISGQHSLFPPVNAMVTIT